MHLTRREIALAGSAAMLVSSAGSIAVAQAGGDAEVAAAVEALRVAIVKADKAKLEELAHDKLAYCHSSGKVETKAQYVAAYTSGKNTYKSLTLADHQNIVAGDNAIARHTFAAEIDRGGGKVDNIKIGITTVWVKEGGSWKLFARQGYKI
ncbi:MAG: nuclear transport factor 2 family protein [Hyphomicrobiaceae bacterium]